MSDYIEAVLENRPTFQPDEPFVAIQDALADAAVALAKVLDYVEVDPADFLEEFALRDGVEQVQFGAKVAVAIMTFRTITADIAAAVTDAFEAVDKTTAEVAA